MVPAGLTNRYNQISQQLQAPGLMPQEKQRLIQEQQQAQMGIYAAQQAGGALVSGAREGGRAVTVGQVQVDIVVNGADKNPAEIAQEAKTKFESGLFKSTNSASLANQQSSAIKR